MGALVFDYDGLMVDSERVMAECVIEIVADHGGQVTFTDFGHVFGSTENDDQWERLLATWTKPPIPVAAMLDLMEPRLRPRVDALPLLPGVLDLIEQASTAGWKLGLATGQAARTLLPNLERLGVLDRFDAIVTAREVPRGKPAPDIFLEVARRLAVSPSQCVVMEDSLPGCQAALAAGMTVVACPSDVGTHLTFPIGARRVATLLGLELVEMLPPAQ